MKRVLRPSRNAAFSCVFLGSCTQSENSLASCTCRTFAQACTQNWRGSGSLARDKQGQERERQDYPEHACRESLGSFLSKRVYFHDAASETVIQTRLAGGRCSRAHFRFLRQPFLSLLSLAWHEVTQALAGSSTLWSGASPLCARAEQESALS